MITNTKSFTARCGVFLALLMAGSATPALAQTASQTDESTAPDTDQADPGMETSRGDSSATWNERTIFGRAKASPGGRRHGASQ